MVSATNEDLILFMYCVLCFRINSLLIAAKYICVVAGLVISFLVYLDSLKFDQNSLSDVGVLFPLFLFYRCIRAKVWLKYAK